MTPGISSRTSNGINSCSWCSVIACVVFVLCSVALCWSSAKHVFKGRAKSLFLHTVVYWLWLDIILCCYFVWGQQLRYIIYILRKKTNKRYIFGFLFDIIKLSHIYKCNINDKRFIQTVQFVDIYLCSTKCMEILISFCNLHVEHDYHYTHVRWCHICMRRRKKCLSLTHSSQRKCSKRL